jgi:hypothetical protein
MKARRHRNRNPISVAALSSAQLAVWNATSTKNAVVTLIPISYPSAFQPSTKSTPDEIHE